ncbi:MTH1187 family thiamine-binding protein [Thiomonas sp. FB-6]|uniref:MTH1187 family thiamine-binding protein n=1 Tax=Thiomonas sp. FB-6 TaxID=1158291 RepID=UPI0003648236|nr:MTH1187 family thiamine-binding protein [Thiomonas sp. FB-6]
MVLLEFAMAPGGKGESVSPYVARILDVIDRSGVPYQLTPMGTILEGDWDGVFGVVKACFEELERDCPRISMNLKMDYRQGEQSRMASKIDAVERKLGRSLSTG